jgi:hypothetical protein
MREMEMRMLVGKGTRSCLLALDDVIALFAIFWSVAWAGTTRPHLVQVLDENIEYEFL